MKIEARPLSLGLDAQLIIDVQEMSHIAASFQIPSSRTFWAWTIAIG